jgi:hypothetical protein
MRSIFGLCQYVFRKIRRDPRLMAVVAMAGLVALAWKGAGLVKREFGAALSDASPADPASKAVDRGFANAAFSDQVHRFCGDCHPYPTPDLFPRANWRDEVSRGFAFNRLSLTPLEEPDFEGVVRHYEELAPERLPDALVQHSPLPCPVTWTSKSVPAISGDAAPAISFLDYVALQPGQAPVIVASEMARGLVMSCDPRSDQPAWNILGRAKNPTTAVVADLDRDGVWDLIIADLGSFFPSAQTCGSVAWLRGQPDGTYLPAHSLLQDVGRVSDVRSADFTGDGLVDLVVASFGDTTSKVGGIYLLTGRTTSGEHPEFEVSVVDARYGGIHVPVIDLNHDGRPDFVALFSDEHEEVTAFLNQGAGAFQPQVLYSAPHPAFGSTGIQLVDLDSDGHQDILCTNGDFVDSLLRPYHSVHWLRNCGDGSLRFEDRRLGYVYGAHRAVAGDVDNDGDLDVVAVAFLPEAWYPQRYERSVDAVILFEQLSPGDFARHTIESGTCDHVACLLADIRGTGRPELIVGGFFLPGSNTGPALQIRTPSPNATSEN